MKRTITIEGRFEYDADTRTFEFSYRLNGQEWPGIQRFYVPTAGHKIGRRTRGKKPGTDRLFDDSEKGRKAAERAEDLFDRELYGTINEALQRLLYEVEHGTKILNENRRVFIQKLEKASRKEALKRLGRWDREQALRQTIYDAARLLLPDKNISLPNIAQHVHRDLRWLKKQVREHIQEGWPAFKAEIERELKPAKGGQKLI